MSASDPDAAAIEADAMDALARDVERTESLRAVKDLQRSYAQYAQFGLWHEMAALFGDSGTMALGPDVARGSAEISRLLAGRFGGGRDGLLPGALHAELIDGPLVNLSAEGETAQARWYGMLLYGDGRDRAGIEGGIHENDYIRERGVWKIAALRFHPQFEGPYETGWINTGGGDLPIIPYHFNPDEAGVPIPPPPGAAPPSRTSLESLELRVAALNDEDAVRNLQHAYGYYVDRKMWADVADLFADDGVVEIAGVGRYRGLAGVRRALKRMGEAGLRHGELNDRPQFGTIVAIAPGGHEAFARGIELGMLGDADRGTAAWKITVFRNRFVKQGGVWKLRELRSFLLAYADYRLGWARGRLPVPASDDAQDEPAAADGPAAVPAFLGCNPVTGLAVALPPGVAVAAATPITGAIAPSAVPPLGEDRAERLDEVARRLAVSAAFDGAENVSSAYGFYIDDFQWPQMGAIFARKGNKQVPFAGYYLGRERITQSVVAQWGEPPMMRPGISYHWRTQPVINVAADGRSANLRTRLFQPRTSKERSRPGTFYAAGFHGGMYPNDQAVLEDGIWRLWSLTIDEPYFYSVDWQSGWAAAKDPLPGVKPPRSVLFSKFPPDIPITDLGRREEHFRGGIGETIEWPGILPMWFNYRNPVSGRVPERYWPDCVPSEHTPRTSMTHHGYLMPPTGPDPELGAGKP